MGRLTLKKIHDIKGRQYRIGRRADDVKSLYRSYYQLAFFLWGFTGITDRDRFVPDDFEGLAEELADYDMAGLFRVFIEKKEAGWRFCCVRCDGPVIRLTIPEESGAPTDMVGDYFFFDDEFMILAEMILRRQTETCSEADRRLLLEDMKRMFNSYRVSLIRQ